MKSKKTLKRLNESFTAIPYMTLSLIFSIRSITLNHNTDTIQKVEVRKGERVKVKEG